MKKILIALVPLLLATGVYAQNQTYKDVLAGKVCKESDIQQLDCEYKVGKDLNVYIAGIGLPDTSITFYASSYDGDYFARVGVLHGCIIVVPGKAASRGIVGEQAFISPVNGKVYQNWQSCKQGY
ncbi:hypothetical protein KFE80_00355 [bacterium SCSIO 12696]|nr:hypothetical protein KFE80_00355 [bacterium SCSIO 12696]